MTESKSKGKGSGKKSDLTLEEVKEKVAAAQRDGSPEALEEAAKVEREFEEANPVDAGQEREGVQVPEGNGEAESK